MFKNKATEVSILHLVMRLNFKSQQKKDFLFQY